MLCHTMLYYIVSYHNCYSTRPQSAAKFVSFILLLYHIILLYYMIILQLLYYCHCRPQVHTIKQLSMLHDNET